MKKKKIVLSLALGLMVLSVSAYGLTNVSSQNVTIYFNAPESKSSQVSGHRDTNSITTSDGAYREEHYGTSTNMYVNSFHSKLVSVKPWYQPNEVKDTSSTLGTTSNKGWNEGSFAANETLRNDMSANGWKGYSMSVQSNTYKK